MMKDFSMHILDIAQNSVAAGARRIKITLEENLADDKLRFEISDDGSGMPEELLNRVRDPFATTRTTRKIGLGIPLLGQTCEQCKGSLEIFSKPGEGAKLTGEMEYSNIDRPPLGDIAACIHILIVANPDIDFLYRHIYNGREYILDTAELRDILDDIPFGEPSVSEWIRQELRDGIKGIKD